MWDFYGNRRHEMGLSSEGTLLNIYTKKWIFNLTFAQIASDRLPANADQITGIGLFYEYIFVKFKSIT